MNRLPLKYITSILFLLINGLNLVAQNQSYSDYGSESKNIIIENEKGVAYKIKVTLPPDYDDKVSYKPVYYLDSWWLSEIVLGSNALLYLSKNIEPLIFIGISVNGDEADWHKQRSLDFTPSPYSIEKMSFSMKAGELNLDSLNSGGASAFIKFLIERIIPEVENNFSIDNNESGFIGHSFGGLFGLVLLLEHPYLFKNYMLISPSLWWNKNEVIQNLSFSNLNKGERPKLFISVGAKESKLITKPVLSINSILNDSTNYIQNYTFRKYDNCNHNSVVPRAVYDGLELFYSSD